MGTDRSIIASKAKEVAIKCAEKLNYEIVDVEYVFEDGINILRVIGRKDGEFDIDDCTALSELVSNELDVLDFIDDEYYLEVCSEGIEKELRNENDVLSAVGEYIFATFNESVDKVKEVYGDLLDFTDNVLTIKYNVKGRIKQMKVNYDNVSYIRLAVKF